MRPTDIRVLGARLYLLPVETRVPLKFGKETVRDVICARVALHVANRAGQSAVGWGETPLSVQWVWPSGTRLEQRRERLIEFCESLARLWSAFDAAGHALEVGHQFIEHQLRPALGSANVSRAPDSEPMPWLAALVCCSPFDQALHDAYGLLAKRPTYETYTADFLNQDLSAFLQSADGARVDFRGLYPAHFLLSQPKRELPAWHLVGGLDAVGKDELTGQEPRDGYPVLLEDWIRVDGLKCLKIKLRGTDSDWDYSRMVKVGELAIRSQVDWLTADFNCTVENCDYVNAILDRLCLEHPRIYGMILYVEQPFPYELEKHRIDVRSVSARKPLFLDESAHDWRNVRLGRELGWSGVALKTCKTQTGALLSACWARAHGMTLMVQDLTNPMLAQIPHLLLAAHVGTIMGVETNAMQFYPEASKPEAEVHPAIYRRRNGCVNLRSVAGAGFGYRLDAMNRALPGARIECGSW